MRTLVGVMTIDIGGYDIKVQYQGRRENDGIGASEYWGYKGYDKGHDVVIIDEIDPLFTDETEEQITEIKRLIDINFDEYAETIAERVEEE